MSVIVSGVIINPVGEPVADTLEIDIDILRKDKSAISLYRLAVRRGKAKGIKRLLINGPDINARD